MLEKHAINCNVKIWKNPFAVVKLKQPITGAFALIQDGKEITAIINQSNLSEKDVIKFEKDFRLLTFEAELPFDLVRFLAKTTVALANENISVFIISSFSTDHLLVKQNQVEKAANVLKELGFNIMHE